MVEEDSFSLGCRQKKYLACFVALKYRPQGLPVEDLVQEGCIDLMRAVFSPEDVVPLPTLAFPSDYS